MVPAKESKNKNGGKYFRSTERRVKVISEIEWRKQHGEAPTFFCGGGLVMNGLDVRSSRARNTLFAAANETKAKATEGG